MPMGRDPRDRGETTRFRFRFMFRFRAVPGDRVAWGSGQILAGTGQVGGWAKGSGERLGDLLPSTPMQVGSIRAAWIWHLCVNSGTRER